MRQFTSFGSGHEKCTICIEWKITLRPWLQHTQYHALSGLTLRLSRKSKCLQSLLYAFTTTNIHPATRERECFMLNSQKYPIQNIKDTIFRITHLHQSQVFTLFFNTSRWQGVSHTKEYSVPTFLGRHKPIKNTAHWMWPYSSNKLSCGNNISCRHTALIQTLND